MRRILAPILLLVFLFPTFAFGETYSDLVIRDGLYYKKFSTVPFTGKTTGKIQGSFKNGKKHGAWVWYWKNGQLKYKDNYKNGKKHGAQVLYHKNGQLFRKGNYKSGEREGAWVSYNEDDTADKEYTGTFKDGVKISE